MDKKDGKKGRDRLEIFIKIAGEKGAASLFRRDLFMNYLYRRCGCILLLNILLTLFCLIRPPHALSGEGMPASQSVASSQISEYRIGYEDVLDIVVWRNTELSKTVTVRPDGMISLPLIGDIRAAGLTPTQVRDSITGKLKEYQQTVVISVIVQGINSYKVFILGEVIKPGVYILRTKTTLLQAIALAGGFNQFASKNKIVVVRERIDDSAPQEKITVSFDDIVNIDSKSDKNLLLRPGDTIFVP